MRPELTLGYSPCPNDTFMFHAIESDALRLPDYDISVRLEDVETLNQLALAQTLDVSKMSFHAWLHVRESYTLLGSGAALGRGCGPVVVTRKNITPEDLSASRIILPGELTTAHLLFQLLAPNAKDTRFVPYDEILPRLQAGEADCGVIIHESRFTFADAGFRAVVDLGEWWENETGLPIPLGCIAAKTSLGAELHHALESLIRRSIKQAIAEPAATDAYVRAHAQELSADVLAQHIRTFVNDFSLDLGEEGRAAVAALETLAMDAGLLA